MGGASLADNHKGSNSKNRSRRLEATTTKGIAPAVRPSDQARRRHHRRQGTSGPGSGYLQEHSEASRAKKVNYETKIEKTANGYSAYVPDLPGCVAAAETLDETQRLIKEAIDFHVEGMVLERNLFAIARVNISYANVLILDAANAVSLHIEIATPPLSITALAHPKHFGVLGGTA